MNNFRIFRKVGLGTALGSTLGAVLLLMNSCQSDGFAEIEDDNLIRFNVGVSENPEVSTKGTLTYYKTTDHDDNFTSFGVYGYEVSPNATTSTPIINTIFDNKNVRLTDGVWSYGTPLFWNSTNNMTFLAYAPYDLDDTGLTIINASSHQLVFTYQLPSDIGNQADLMVATVAPTSQVGSDVMLTFDHMLSAITFSVKGEPTAKITEIEISGVSTSGILSASSFGNNTEDIDPLTGVYNRVWRDWNDVADNDTTIDIPLITENTTPVSGETNRIVSDDNYAMMIPQTHGMYGQIKVVIEDLTTTNTSITKYIPLDGTQWLAGKRYDYEIEIDAQDFDFNLHVRPWSEIGSEFEYDLQ